MSKPEPDFVDAAFAGYGMALRREDEPPIPGEPLMSMADAKRITRELLARSVRPASGEVEELVAEARDNAALVRRAGSYAYPEWMADVFDRLATALDRINREGSHE